MDWERFSNDQLDEILCAAERKESEGRSIKIDVLEELDRRQVFTADGSRNLSEWYSARADIGLDTARSVVQTMRRTSDKPWLRQALAKGEVSYDRAEALSRIPEGVGDLGHLDVAGVRRAAADLARVTAEDETQTAADQHLVLQPSLDRSWWKIWGGLDGVTGAAVDNALTEKADALPDFPDGTKGSQSWRRALALYELATGGQTPQAHISVFVDGQAAVETSGEAGVRLEAGPLFPRRNDGGKVPARAKRAEVRGMAGSRQRFWRVFAVPLRRFLLGIATSPVAFASGGGIVIHQQGFELYEHSKTSRIRFRKRDISHSDSIPVEAGRRAQG